MRMPLRQRLKLTVFRVVYRALAPVVAEALREQAPQLEDLRRRLEAAEAALTNVYAAVAAAEAQAQQVDRLRVAADRLDGNLRASVASLDVAIENLRDELAALEERLATRSRVAGSVGG